MPTEEPKPSSTEHSGTPEAPSGPAARPPRKRRTRMVVILALLAVAILFVAVPRIIRALNTVSTDDAYVNGYVTFVAPRVAGQLARVLVDDNNRVKKGDVLVELDPEPFRVQVAIKQAAVDTAEANVIVAHATVRSQLGQTRGLRFKLQHAIEDVDNQVALIRARVATWEQNKATQALAEAEFDAATHMLR